MLHVCRREQFAVLAYCFMPNHVHLLVTATGTGANAAELVRFLKQETAYVFRKTGGQRLWQRSFFDRTLRSDENVKDVVSYIVMNPVRAGLVASVGDYPYWGSETYNRSQILEFVGRPEGRPLHSGPGPT
jgi:REP element-mobilizing transposase RayT